MQILLGRGDFGIHIGNAGKYPCLIFSKQPRQEPGKISIITPQEKQQITPVGGIAFGSVESVDIMMEQLTLIRAKLIGK